jgi:hypothetical protein
MVSPASAFASPKSSSFTVPSGVTLMFADLRSRWMMPFSCAASSPAAFWRAITSASSTGTGPRRVKILVAREVPSTSTLNS